jgi:hypothetical protein
MRSPIAVADSEGEPARALSAFACGAVSSPAGAVPAPPAGFASRVIDAARRRSPVVDSGVDMIALCRRILLAAHRLCSVAAVAQRPVRAKGDGTLEAAPDEAAEVTALDARIQAVSLKGRK